MNSNSNEQLKVKRNCLLVFRNKKINSFDGAIELINRFADAGYYFDEVSYFAFDKPDIVVRALMEGKTHYENLVVLCPFEMEKTLKKFLSSVYASEFNELGILKNGKENVFMFFSDVENRILFDDVKGILDNKYGVKYDKSFVKTVSASVEEVNAAIASAINSEPEKIDTVSKLINFNVSDNYGDCTVEVVYSEEVPKSIYDKVFRTLVNSLEKYVYAIENFELSERLVQLLRLRRMKVSVAESFTGGGISKKLVSVPGVSEVYYEGLNTYSNGAKIQRLGVYEDSLRQFGAVSEETAVQMAEGLISTGNCDISIATTGIAGPKSDNTNKPVGLVYIAIGLKERTDVYKYNLKGTREQITETAINLALFLAYKTLK